VVTRLVAFVPPAVKLMIGVLGALALLFGISTLAGRRKLAVARSRAVTDALTGLPDHSSIHDELGQMVAAAKRAGGAMAVVLIDLDNFKRINDSYGHLKGDDVLRAVSDKARTELRTNDFVGRYGGEEFMAILPETERDGAVAVVDRLRRAFWEIETGGVRELITASMGVAAYPVDGSSANELIEAADDALYAAKAGGRNQVRTATPAGGSGVRRLSEARGAATARQPASVAARPLL
jgi:diguanylate cyclase (GGDEF)-like protein